MKTGLCEPTLNDSQVLAFCKNGFLMLEGVVAAETNKRTFAYLEEHSSLAPSEILQENWFVDNVILNPQALGAVRSVLGEKFSLTMPFMANHRVECPAPAQHWHRDGGSVHSHQLDSLQVFYYPQDTPLELGPTEVVPGSHFLFALQGYMRHYGSIRNTIPTAAPAGSIFLTVYSIWHRRSASTASGTRNLLKYWYKRTVPPQRDWIIEPGFKLEHTYQADAEHPFNRETHRTRNDAAEIFYWLCGEHDQYDAKRKNLPVYYYENAQS